jgi:hypothetical protein
MTNEVASEHSTGAQGFNLVLAYALHLFVGLFWVPGIAGIVGIARSAAVGWVWGFCALALWARGAVRAPRQRADFGAAWAPSSARGFSAPSGRSAARSLRIRGTEAPKRSLPRNLWRSL